MLRLRCRVVLLPSRICPPAHVVLRYDPLLLQLLSQGSEREDWSCCFCHCCLDLLHRLDTYLIYHLPLAGKRPSSPLGTSLCTFVCTSKRQNMEDHRCISKVNILKAGGHNCVMKANQTWSLCL